MASDEETNNLDEMEEEMDDDVKDGSDYIEHAAEEDSEEEGGGTKKHRDDDEEDSENDEDVPDYYEKDDFIVDEEEEEEGEVDRKRPRESDEGERRRNKHKRLRRLKKLKKKRADDDLNLNDEIEQEAEAIVAGDTDALKQNLFGADDGEYYDNQEEEQPQRSRVREKRPVHHDDEYDDLDDEEDDFIEGGRHSLLREARDIFGEDVDLRDLENEEFENDNYYEEDEDVEDLQDRRPKSEFEKLQEQFEPDVLKAKFFTDVDELIRQTDKPERYQLAYGTADRPLPSEEELEEEATWIYESVLQGRLSTKTSSSDDIWAIDNETNDNNDNKKDEYIREIGTVLGYMLKQYFDIPFIFTYRREYIEELIKTKNWTAEKPEYTDVHLWTIYEWDLKWMRISKRKADLKALYEKLVDQKPLTMLSQAKTVEAISDIAEYVQLHYGDELEKATEGAYRRPRRANVYNSFKRAGIDRFIKKFGLSAKQYAENLSSGFVMNSVDDDDQEPEAAAQEFVSDRVYTTVEKVLAAGVEMMAYEISLEPVVRQKLRAAYEQSALISTAPTPKRVPGSTGAPLLEDVSISTFKGNADYLEIVKAERDGLLTVHVTIHRDTMEQCLDYRNLFFSDKTRAQARAWNQKREDVMRRAIELLRPTMENYIKQKLANDAREFVRDHATAELTNMLMKGPIGLKRSESLKPQKDPDAYSVLAACYGSQTEPTTFVMLDVDGECIDQLQWKLLSTRANRTRRPAEMQEQENRLKGFIRRHEPDVIALGINGLDSRDLHADITKILSEMTAEMPAAEDDSVYHIDKVKIEWVPEDVARIYEVSPAAVNQFPEYSNITRRAISVGRRLQDPLAEIAGLADEKDDITSLKFHKYQDVVPKDSFREALERALVYVSNRVGADINKMVLHKHLASTLKFISGLGPRKANYFLQRVSSLEGATLKCRRDLVEEDIVGKNIFINCAGFIRIKENDLITSADFDVLEDTRIHPESYQLALKMSADALEEEGTGGQLQAFVEKVMDAPQTLEDLDLVAYAKDLEEKTTMGKKGITLQDIKNELQRPFWDPRNDYEPLQPEEIFEYMTGETPESFYEGMFIPVTIIRNLGRGRYDRYDRFDGDRGEILVSLDNGLTGRIVSHDLAQEQIEPGSSVLCKILSIRKSNPDSFGVELSCLMRDREEYEAKQANREMQEREKLRMMRQDSEAQKKKAEKKKDARRLKHHRIIKHPDFHNFTHMEAMEFLKDKPEGDVVIRPSSKAADHLTVTFKFYGNKYINLDVKEQNKTDKFSLGKELYIGNIKYDDLDHIENSYVVPMMRNAQQLVEHEKFCAAPREEIENILKQEKAQNPARIPYRIGLDPDHPGRFLIHYMQHRVKAETVVVRPTGYHYHGVDYTHPVKLINAFKSYIQNRGRPNSSQGHHRGGNQPPSRHSSSSSGGSRRPDDRRSSGSSSSSHRHRNGGSSSSSGYRA